MCKDKIKKGLALVSLMAIGSGAVAKSMQYVKNKKEKERQLELEAGLNKENASKAIKILKSISEVTNKKYEIGVPTDDDSVDFNLTEYLKEEGLIGKDEAVIEE